MFGLIFFFTILFSQRHKGKKKTGNLSVMQTICIVVVYKGKPCRVVKRLLGRLITSLIWRYFGTKPGCDFPEDGHRSIFPRDNDLNHHSQEPADENTECYILQRPCTVNTWIWVILGICFEFKMAVYMYKPSNIKEHEMICIEKRIRIPLQVSKTL